MRNKAKDFPDDNMTGEGEKARAKARYVSKRANGTTNTHPQERMKASSERTRES